MDTIIYAKKEFGSTTTAVIDSSKFFIQPEQLQKEGITIGHLSTSEVCMYLTSKEGRDIDAVFD